MSKKVKHQGVSHERTKHDCNYKEKIFADKWEEENQTNSCIAPVLACLMNTKTERTTSFQHVNQRDAEVAATVIQWLGSNVGNCFMQECLKAIEKHNTPTGGKEK